MIDDAIRGVIVQELDPNEVYLSMVDSSCPMYILHYSTEQGIVEVTLMFDVLRNELEIENMQLQ